MDKTESTLKMAREIAEITKVQFQVEPGRMATVVDYILEHAQQPLGVSEFLEKGPEIVLWAADEIDTLQKDLKAERAKLSMAGGIIGALIAKCCEAGIDVCHLCEGGGGEDCHGDYREWRGLEAEDGANT